MHFDFPLWLRITHLLNLIFLVLLARSGIQILMDHPKLYWKDDSKDGTEWIKFSKKKMPTDKLWTSMDEADAPRNRIIALPGGFHNLGAARNWHFLTGIFWFGTGIYYVSSMFISDQWRQLVPTSWSIIPGAWHSLLTYLSFHIPPASAFQPFDPLQQLAYFAVVFILPLHMLATGLAMSPAMIAHFPWYTKLFGGRQKARSFHFLGLVAFILFVIIHVALVCLVYFGNNIRNIVFGSEHGSILDASLIALGFIVLVILFNILITWFTLRHQRSWQRLSTFFLHPFIRTVFGWMGARQKYTEADYTNNFRVNGYPPETAGWLELKDENFKNWKLKVGGLVENKLELSLQDIKDLHKQEQITKHNCIQGWSAVGKWGGVPMRFIISFAKPSKKVKYVAFYGYDVDNKGREYYETIEMRDAKDPMTILAYEFMGKTLPIEHGAPLRLRCERKLGYKMTKYLKRIEFIEDYRTIGEGMGGFREDTQYYDRVASI
ncbi:MAG: molybdopterin-dependent oxidoreductase [Candidatus Saccharimonadales bacterium]